MTHSRGCDGCGAVLASAASVVDRRSGKATLIHLCRRCVTAPGRTWRRRYRLVEVEQ